MNKLTSIAFASILATTGTAAFAEQDTRAVDQTSPVAMTDAQMDSVAAGALINVVAVDVVDISNVLNNNDVRINIPVNAAVAVLGQATAIQGRPGRIFP